MGKFWFHSELVEQKNQPSSDTEEKKGTPQKTLLIYFFLSKAMQFEDNKCFEIRSVFGSTFSFSELLKHTFDKNCSN